LGIFLKDKENNFDFYYFQTWTFYGDSLTQFGFIDPERINKEKYSKIIKEMFDREKDINYMQEFVKYKFPLRFVSSLYSIYLNVNDRIFFF